MITVKLAKATRGVYAKEFDSLTGLKAKIFATFQLEDANDELDPDCLEIAYIDEDDEEIHVDHDHEFEIMYELITEACQMHKPFTVICKELAICPVCYEYLKETGPNDPDRPTRLSNCNDILHRSCLREHCLMMINENKFPVKCINDQCVFTIAHSDMKAILQTDEYDRFIRFMTSMIKLQMRGVVECPDPQCDFFFDNGENELADRFNCINCYQEYCLKCNVPWHYDKTCLDMKADAINTNVDLDAELI